VCRSLPHPRIARRSRILVLVNHLLGVDLRWFAPWVERVQTEVLRLNEQGEAMKLKRSQSPLKKKARRGFRGYPVATIAFYGPDDKRASKVAVGIVADEGGSAEVLERWFSEIGDVRTDQDVGREIIAFIQEHGVKSVIMPDRIIGCPHEEGVDYPDGEICPQCPFWAGRDRWFGEITQ